jgi:hypothetical protein
MPNGFQKWLSYMPHQQSLSNFFWYGNTMRIMSMYGAALFEIGVLGIIIPYCINAWAYKFLEIKNFKRYRITLLMALNLIFLTAVPLATPFVGFILGAFLYYNHCFKINKHQEN